MPIRFHIVSLLGMKEQCLAALATLDTGAAWHLRLSASGLFVHGLSFIVVTSQQTLSSDIHLTDKLFLVSPETDPISDQERELRVHLAALYRLVDHFGWCDLIETHSSARIPGTEHFLINPYTRRFDEICASNLVKVDKDANIVGDPTQEINPAGFIIHSAIHMFRPDIHCIIHTHTTAGMAVAALACGVLPISIHALGYYGRIGYHDFEGPSLHMDERERLGRDLGNNDILILRNHGLLVCGATVAQAFVRMHRLQRVCEVQIAALSTGQELVVPSKEICELSAKRTDAFLSAEAGKGYSRKANPEFEAMLRLLDRKDPSYRD